MEDGDIFVVRTPGGGGYGKPLDREPALVLQDVLNGLISVKAAEKDYGVIIDSVTMKVDWNATQKLRATKSTKTYRIDRK